MYIFALMYFTKIHNIFFFIEFINGCRKVIHFRPTNYWSVCRSCSAKKLKFQVFQLSAIYVKSVLTIICLFWTVIYSQTCIKRSWPLGQRKGGLLRQVTFKRGSIHMKFSMTWQEICDLFNTGDYLIEMTIWEGLTVLRIYI
jgi:hypothetical protein